MSPTAASSAVPHLVRGGGELVFVEVHPVRLVQFVQVEVDAERRVAVERVDPLRDVQFIPGPLRHLPGKQHTSCSCQSNPKFALASICSEPGFAQRAAERTNQNALGNCRAKQNIDHPLNINGMCRPCFLTDHWKLHTIGVGGAKISLPRKSSVFCQEYLHRQCFCFIFKLLLLEAAKCTSW